MTASIHFITPRKPKRLKTPSDKLSKRELISLVKRAALKKINDAERRGLEILSNAKKGKTP